MYTNDGRFPHYPEPVPALLKLGQVWVCCDENKVPMIADAARPPRRAKSTDSETWRSYGAALSAYEAGKFVGIGRVIRASESLVGVDLDHCRDPETGAITPRARWILDALDSYSEVSPSGTGVKVWVIADLKRSRIKPGVEIYGRGRYFTVTGQILTQYSGEVEERSDALGEVVAAEFPERGKRHRGAGGRVPGRRIDLGGFIDRWKVEVLSEVGDGDAELKFSILCPWIHEHTTAPESGTFVGQYPNGATFFHCYHSHCHGRHWPNFRRAVELHSRLGSFSEVKVSYGG